MNDHLEHGQRILSLAHAVIGGRSLEQAEVAFTMLCGLDLEAAIHLADLLALACPSSASLWQEIIDHAAIEQRDIDRSARAKQPEAPNRIEQSGPAMSADDTRDTAGGLAANMGWIRGLQ